jgi:1,4-dihydroxy-2-naphthoate octaprenyltransferase
VDRLTWLVLALVLVLGAVYLHVHQESDWLAYLLGGIGIGIGLALTGSLIRDAFAGQPRG